MIFVPLKENEIKKLKKNWKKLNIKKIFSSIMRVLKLKKITR